MVPNLLSPHPFNAPLLPPLRFRASSLSSPRREIGLMKLKGMGLSQHCRFQWHCLILPNPSSRNPSTPPPPPPPPPPHTYTHTQPNWLHTRITATIYNTHHKRSLSHTLHQCILLPPASPPFQSANSQAKRQPRRKKAAGWSARPYGIFEALEIISWEWDSTGQDTCLLTDRNSKTIKRNMLR